MEMDVHKTMSKLPLLLLLLSVLHQTSCEKILGFFPLSSRSHLNMYKPLFLELAARGHEITFIAIAKPEFQSPNITEYDVPEMLAIFQDEDMKYIFTNASENAFMKMVLFIDAFINVCKVTLSSSAVQGVLKKGQVFDLVIVGGYGCECPVQLSPMLAKHVVMISASPVVTMLTFPYTSYPSFVPERALPIPPQMNFLQRLQNAMGVFMSRKIFQYIHWRDEALVLEAFPNAPTMAEAQNKISLILVNSDPVLSVPHPYTPRIIPVGTMHIKDPKPLPKDLEEFVASSGDEGFILFTLGSITPAELMPKETQQAFISAFARLKQKVIWKYKGEIENLPPNLMLSPWLPQQDLLGHPKIRLFMTHCGLLGLQEAVHFGVPVVGIPLYGDQGGNIALMKSYGLGEEFKPILSLTADEIFQTLTTMLNTKSYKENMKKYSSIIRDQILPPAQRAAYWVEYVLRHNGAHHLRSPGEDLNFIEYFLLDVIGFLILSTALILWTLKRTIAALCKFFKRQSHTSVIKKKN